MAVAEEKIPDNGDHVTIVDGDGNVLAHGEMLESELDPNDLPSNIVAKHDRVVGWWHEVHNMVRVRGAEMQFTKWEVFGPADDGYQELTRADERKLSTLVDGAFTIWHEFVVPRKNTVADKKSKKATVADKKSKKAKKGKKQ